MALRIESNNLRGASAAANVGTMGTNDGYVNRQRIHSFTVDTGVSCNVLAIVIHAMYIAPPAISALLPGHGFINALTDTSSNLWYDTLEFWWGTGYRHYHSSVPPRLIVLPLGSGIALTAGQGMGADVLQSATTSGYIYTSAFFCDMT